MIGQLVLGVASPVTTANTASTASTANTAGTANTAIETLIGVRGRGARNGVRGRVMGRSNLCTRV